MTVLINGNPWELTLEEFLNRLVSEHGFKRGYFADIDSSGGVVRRPYVENPDGRVFHFPAGQELEDQLNAFVTASLCRRLGISGTLFGLPESMELPFLTEPH